VAAVRRIPWEIWAVLALIVLDGIAVIATYSRFPHSELYNFPNGGTFVAGGLGRELVALNFPFALVGIAFVGLAWPRLSGRLRILGVVAIALCAVVDYSVNQSNLDARPINAVPVLGLAIGVALVLAVGVSDARQTRGDGVRIGLAAVLVFFAAPLIAAELGFYLDGVPVLGWFYETARLTTQPGINELHHAVHHGQHHGWQGTMLALTALALSRLPRPRVMDAYLALMLAYGIGNLVNDDWLEQVVKRGWTSHEVPNVLTPAANLGWAAVLVGAFVVWRFWFRQPSPTTPAEASPAISSSA
jgi:hypothetical protein